MTTNVFSPLAASMILSKSGEAVVEILSARISSPQAPSMDLNLRNQTAIITGGASGIGAATAAAFQEEGCNVAIWDLAEPTTDDFFVKADITSPSDLNRALAATTQEFGRIDHLVHAAAIGSGKYGFPFDRLVPDDWQRVLHVNIMGTTQVAHTVAPILREQQSGTMTLIASIAGQIGSQTDPPYSASKAANINFAQCLAKDLAPHRVRVNTICPGMIQTPLNKSVWQAWAKTQPKEQVLSYEDWAGEKIRKLVPLGKWQTPEDIANAIVFLASDRAAQITGQTINVDGGFVMHW